jgi:hypothetical protein
MGDDKRGDYGEDEGDIEEDFDALSFNVRVVNTITPIPKPGFHKTRIIAKSGKT